MGPRPAGSIIAAVIPTISVRVAAWAEPRPRTPVQPKRSGATGRPSQVNRANGMEAISDVFLGGLATRPFSVMA